MYYVEIFTALGRWEAILRTPVEARAEEEYALYVVSYGTERVRIVQKSDRVDPASDGYILEQ